MQFEKLNFGSSKLLYLQVANSIEGSIIRKEIKVGEKVPPERELCKAFGVSLDTVKGALAKLEDEGYINRRRRHGTFVINSCPVKLTTLERKKEICIVICTGPIRKTAGNQSFYEIINGVEEKLKEKKLNLLYKTINGDDELDFHEKAKEIAGLVVAGNITRKHIRMIEKTRMPYVQIGDVFNEETENEKVDVICTDDYRQTYLAASHLIELGHKKILYFTTRLSKMFQFDVNSLNGYQKALEHAGIPCDKNLQVGTENDIDAKAGYSVMKDFLKSGRSSFTGLICTSGSLYTGILKAFRENNISVPEDISAVNIEYLPEVTSITCENRCFGITAVERLVERLTNPGWKPERVVIPCELNIGESTKTNLNRMYCQ